MATVRGRSTSPKRAPKGGARAPADGAKARSARAVKGEVDKVVPPARRTARSPENTSARPTAAKKASSKKAAKKASAKKAAPARPRAKRRLTTAPPRARARATAPAKGVEVAAPSPRKKGRATPARSPAKASPPARSPAKASPPKVSPARPSAPRASPGFSSDRQAPLRTDEVLPMVMGRMMELHWGDEPSAAPRVEGLVQRWVKRGDALLRHLAEHGAARHEYRADLKEGRFVWVAPDGQVSAEAQAQVLCSYVRSTSALSMAWGDPMTRHMAIPRLEGMPTERDDLDEEGAWRVAMHAAELTKADYLYRVTTPHAWYFLALKGLSFAPQRRSFSPSTPVGLVLRALGEVRRGIESRAEPTEVVRSRLSGVGKALLHEAEYVYRGTDWVARLERAGRCMSQLAERLPRGSYSSVAAGRCVDEWLDRVETIELLQALALLEDEWALFA